MPKLTSQLTFAFAVLLIATGCNETSSNPSSGMSLNEISSQIVTDSLKAKQKEALLGDLPHNSFSDDITQFSVDWPKQGDPTMKVTFVLRSTQQSLQLIGETKKGDVIEFTSASDSNISGYGQCRNLTGYSDCDNFRINIVHRHEGSEEIAQLRASTMPGPQIAINYSSGENVRKDDRASMMYQLQEATLSGQNGLNLVNFRVVTNGNFGNYFVTTGTFKAAATTSFALSGELGTNKAMTFYKRIARGRSVKQVGPWTTHVSTLDVVTSPGLRFGIVLHIAIQDPESAGGVSEIVISKSDGI